MFKIGDNVSFGVRHGNGVKRGGIARLTGVVIDNATFDNAAELLIVKANGKLYNLRELKGGWVVETERDDPKGRLYLKLV